MKSMNKIIQYIFLKVKMMEAIRYIIIGILTTFIGYSSFWIFYYVFNFDPNLSNILSIILAIIFAFIANKVYVFKSVTNSVKGIMKEAITFLISRGISIIVEILGVLVLVSFFKLNPMISKISVGIFVVILNYFTSKFMVFNISMNGRK